MLKTSRLGGQRVAEALKREPNRGDERFRGDEVSESAEILSDVGEGLLYGFSCRFRGHFRLVSHTQR